MEVVIQPERQTALEAEAAEQSLVPDAIIQKLVDDYCDQLIYKHAIVPTADEWAALQIANATLRSQLSASGIMTPVQPTPPTSG